VLLVSQEAKDLSDQPDLMAHLVTLDLTDQSDYKDKLEELGFPEREVQWEFVVMMA